MRRLARLLGLIATILAIAGCGSVTTVEPAETVVVEITTPAPQKRDAPDPEPKCDPPMIEIILPRAEPAPEVRGFRHPLIAVVACLVAAQDADSVEIEIGDQTVRAPAGSKVRVVKSKGSRVSSSSAEVVAQVNTTPPEASLDGAGGASGSAGGLKYAVELTNPRSSATVLFVLGGLMIVAGVVIGWIGRLRLGIALGAGGLLLIGVGVVAEAYPWVMLVGLLAVVGVGVFILIDSRRAARAPEALQTVATGLKRWLSPDGYAAAKAAVAKEAAERGNGRVVETEVEAEKRRAGL